MSGGSRTTATAPLGFCLSPTGAVFGGVLATVITQDNLRYAVVPAGAQSGSFRLLTGADTSNALPSTVTFLIGLTSYCA